MSSGTAYSAADVSGIVALMLQRKPGLCPGTVCSILMATAKHLGPRGRDSLSGTGLADAYGALPAEKARLAAGLPIERARPGGTEANC